MPRKIPRFYSLKFKYEDSKQQSSSLILADLKLYKGSKSHLHGDAGQTHWTRKPIARAERKPL